MTLTFNQGHKCISTWTTFNLQYLGQYLSYYIQTWHDGKLMDAIYAHFNDLDVDARSQWVGKGKENQSWMLSATKQATSIKLATMVGHFLSDLDFANTYMTWPSWVFFSNYLVILKVSQGLWNSDECVKLDRDYYHAMSQRSWLNSIQENANIKVFVKEGNVSITKICYKYWKRYVQVHIPIYT